jgi:hypothetical protein
MLHNKKFGIALWELALGSVLLASAVCLAVEAVESDEGKVFLCADSATAAKSKPKLVYGYIDGKKTACMPERELLTLIGGKRFERDTTGKSASQLEKEREAARAQSVASADTVVLAIRKGKKDLAGLDLMRADLSGADMRNADLTSADLRGANLSKADLRGATLEAAFLRKANLAGADLTGANLKGAYFTYADLTGAKGLTLEALKSLYNLYGAKLDQEVRVVAEKEIPQKLKNPEKCWDKNRWSDNDDCNPSKGLRMPK